MTVEKPGFSRRSLLRTAAVGVPAMGLLGAVNLVGAPAAKAVTADGWWGTETSAGLQRFMNAVFGAGLVVDGMISSQPNNYEAWWDVNSPVNAGQGAIVGGWEWVPGERATGSPTIAYMQRWLGTERRIKGIITPDDIRALQNHYGLTADGSLSAGGGPSPTVMALQNEINEYVE